MTYVASIFGCCITSSAKSVEIDNISYVIDMEAGTASIEQQDYMQTMYIEEAIIPEKISYKGKEYTVVALEDKAFYGCGNMTKVVLPNTVSRVGKKCFRDCSKLVDVTLPENLPALSETMFDGCESLREIKLPQGITSIPSFCFSKCGNLRSIVIPEGVTDIMSQAFQYNYQLKDITIPSTLKNCESDFDCNDVRVHISDFDSFARINHVYPPFPGMNNTFQLYLDGELLENIKLPEGVVSTDMFSHCSSMVSISLSSTVESCHFDDRNDSLESITINPAIQSVYIGYVENLKLVNCYSVTPPEATIHLSGICNAVLHVPEGSASAYESDEEWSQFGSIIDDLGDFAGIEGILTGNDSTEEYFNLNGLKMNGVPDKPGIYVKRLGNHSEKVIVR